MWFPLQSILHPSGEASPRSTEVHAADRPRYEVHSLGGVVEIPGGSASSKSEIG